MIKKIHSDKAPKAVGPYSQALVCDKLVFCSGQIGIDPETGILDSGIEKQTERVLKNLEAILKKANSNLSKVLKTTVFLKNINEYAKMNEIYEKCFGNHKPTRSTIEVSNLPKGALIEIEVTASI